MRGGEYSLSDIAAATGNGTNGMFGGDWAWIIVLFLIFGWGRNGFGGNNGGDSGCCYNGFGAPNIYGKLDGISYGIADLGFNLSNTLCQGFSGINQSITTNGYETRNAINDLGYRLQDCCCQTQRAIDGVNYNLAQNACAINNTINNSTRDILENNNCNTRAILDFLTKDKIDTLQAENTALRFQASQTAQNAFITANQDAQTAELIRRLGADCPVPAYVVQPSTPVSFPVNCCGQFTGFNNSCNNY